MIKSIKIILMLLTLSTGISTTIPNVQLKYEVKVVDLFNWKFSKLEGDFTGIKSSCIRTME